MSKKAVWLSDMYDNGPSGNFFGAGEFVFSSPEDVGRFIGSDHDIIIVGPFCLIGHHTNGCGNNFNQERERRMNLVRFLDAQEREHATIFILCSEITMFCYRELCSPVAVDKALITKYPLMRLYDISDGWADFHKDLELAFRS